MVRRRFNWPHLRVGEHRVVDVPAGRGLAAYRRFLVASKCGNEVETTLTTYKPDFVRCDACKEAGDETAANPEAPKV